MDVNSVDGMNAHISNKLRTMDRQQKIKSMQNEIMAQGAVNDMVDNAVNQSAAKRIQSAVRNKNARKEVKGKQRTEEIRQMVAQTRPSTDLVAPPRNSSRLRPTPYYPYTQSEQLAAAKRDALRMAQTMQPQYNMRQASRPEAATSIQTAIRGHLARNELGNRINAAEQQPAFSGIRPSVVQARNTLTSAIRGRKARHELATNQQQFNPIDYQDALRANKKTFQNQVLDYSIIILTDDDNQ